MNLIPHIKAQYSILYLVTPEEARAEKLILETAAACKRGLQVWSTTEGLRTFSKGKMDVEQVEDPIAALENMKGGPRETIYIVKDLPINEDKVIRLLRDIARDFKQSKKTLIMLSPVRKIPSALERDLTVIEFDLPKRPDIESLFNTLYDNGTKETIEKLRKMTEDERERIIQAAMGLTTIEAENAMAKALVEFAGMPEAERANAAISKLVLREKAQAVKKSGILEYIESAQTTNDIGGLENLKAWLALRSKAFSSIARQFKLPMPRGILLAGLPGCGKSLSAKVASNILGVPLLRLDVGRVFGGLVGESEENMRRVIQTVEAIGNCVLWIDEMEKAFAGMGGSSTDGGTSQRVFGSFITWMQEKTAPCFIVATVNRIEGLPPELLRKGRFDEIFFVGLPQRKEREEILKIHVKKYGRKPEDFKSSYENWVEESDSFSGAELEEAVVSGLYAAFGRHKDGEDINKCVVKPADILLAIKQTNPLAKSRATELGAMAKWAGENAINASKLEKTGKKSEVQTTGGRQLDLEQE